MATMTTTASQAPTQRDGGERPSRTVAPVWLSRAKSGAGAPTGSIVSTVVRPESALVIRRLLGVRC